MAYRLLRIMKKYFCFGYMLRNTGLPNENNSRLNGSGDEPNFDSESELCDLHHSSKNGSSSVSATDNEMSSTAIDPHEELDKCARVLDEKVTATASTSSSSNIVQQHQPTQNISATINCRHLIKGSGQSIDTAITNLNNINENNDAEEGRPRLEYNRSFSQPAVHVYVLENRKASEQHSLIDGSASEIVIVAVAPLMTQRRASVGSLNFERKPFW